MTEGGFRPFESDLTIHLTTRTKDSHAIPVIIFPL
jgi:hypothetical protein